MAVCGLPAGATRFPNQLLLISTPDAAGVNPGSYIADILPRIDTWPKRGLDELLPHAKVVAGRAARPVIVLDHVVVYQDVELPHLRLLWAIGVLLGPRGER